MRLRQVVLAARELDPVVERLRAALPLGEPYADPGVGAFGLRNAVMALGDTFVEVVSPVRADTTAGRFLDRRGGDGGYMVLVQVEDTDAVRARAESLGVRIVWQIDLPEISGTHLHPKDTGGTLLSLDTPRPPESWHWAGPAWTGSAPPTGPARVAGATVAVADPGRVAARWGEILDLPVDGTALALDGGRISFVDAGGAPEGLCAVDVAGGAGADAEIAGVRFCSQPA